MSKLHPLFPFKHFFLLFSVFLFILTQELSYLMELVLEYRIIYFQMAFCCSVICVKLTSGGNSIPATQLLHKAATIINFIRGIRQTLRDSISTEISFCQTPCYIISSLGCFVNTWSTTAINVASLSNYKSTTIAF